MSQGTGEDFERTRRIQEEIRRKIAQRRGQVEPPRLPAVKNERPVAPPVMAPRPTATPMGGLREMLERKLAEARAQQAAASETRRRREQAEANARQKEQDAEQRAARQRQAELAAAARKAEEAQRKIVASSKFVPKRWNEQLRNPANLRQAIVLREILDPPVSLR